MGVRGGIPPGVLYRCEKTGVAKRGICKLMKTIRIEIDGCGGHPVCPVFGFGGEKFSESDGGKDGFAAR